MLLFVIVLLTIASIALRVAIGSLEVAFYVADKADKIRRATEGAVVHASRHVGRKTYKAVDGTRTVIDTGFSVAGKAMNVVKPFAKFAMKSTLKVLRFIVSSLRNIFVLLEGMFLVLDVVMFFIIIVAGAGYIALFCTTSEDGGIIINPDLQLVGHYSDSAEEEEENSSSSSGGDFKTYNLSNDEIRQLANLCWQEQGSERGAAAEIALMCNLYESSRGAGYDSLCSYVRNSGWFANASYFMDSGSSPDSIKTIVANSANKGFRVLPKYVDEHDCFSDISSAVNNSGSINVSDRSAYKMHETRMSNVYGSSYIFYCFPESNSDPFGYTSPELRKELGDGCYTFEECMAGKKL